MIYQIFVVNKELGTAEWTTLVSRPTLLADGRTIITKVLENGDLQYLRRTGEAGVLPAADKWTGGEPRARQWREHPNESLRPLPVFQSAPK